MLRLLSYTLIVGLIALFNYHNENYIKLNSQLTFYSHSLLELELIEGGGNYETYKYKDVSLNEDVKISRRLFENGFTLLNVQQPYEGLDSSFRIIFKDGSSSDPLSLPGIRYFALFLFSKQLNRCMKKSSNDELSASFKIKVDAYSSTLIFTFLSKNTNKFFSCLISTIKNDAYLEDSSYLVQILQASEEFETMINDPKSTEIDRLVIRAIYSSLPLPGCNSLQISSIFSQTCYKSSVNLDTELPNHSMKIVNQIFNPNYMFAIFIGRTSDQDLEKMLAKIIKKKMISQPQIDKNKIAIANNAINNMGSKIVVRRGLSADILKFHIPFNIDDKDLLTTNAHLFVSAIIASLHRSGISNFCFMNEFITNLQSHFYIEYGTLVLLLHLNITRKGLQNVPVIIESVMSYFNLLKNSPMSDRVYYETQRLFDYYISSSTIAFVDVMEYYLKSHLIMSITPNNILSSSMNTKFTRSDVENFLSKMSIDSAIVTVSMTDKFDPLIILSKQKKRNEIFPKEIIEPHSNVPVQVFEMDDILPYKISSLSQSYIVNKFGLLLPNEELIGTITLPTFHSKPTFNKFIPLHRSLDIHYKYISESNKRIAISHSMAFKSLTTSKIWFSNNELFFKNINLELKFSLRKWSPLMRNFNGKISAFKILTTAHIMVSIINIKLNEVLNYSHRLGVLVQFIPPQSYKDAVSDPFELYLIVNAPVSHFSLIMSQVSKVLLSFNEYISDENIFSKARKFAKLTLLNIYTGFSTFEKDLKVLTQIVSSQHCSFVKIGKAFEESIDLDLIRAVYASFLNAPSFYGFIEGNLTPFQANHILNIFIESLNHEHFEKKKNPENFRELFGKVSNSDQQDGNGSLKILPDISIGTSVLDISTIPFEYTKIYTQKLDITTNTSSSTIAVLVGGLNELNFVKASLFREALTIEFSERLPNIKNVSFKSTISFIVNSFVVVLLSVRSEELSSGSLTRILYENFTKSVSKIVKNSKSKSYIENILYFTNLKENLHDMKFLFSRPNLKNLVTNSNKFLDSLKDSGISKLLKDLANNPSVIIATQRVSNVKASISSFDYIPSGYKDIGDNYKCLLDDPRTKFDYDPIPE